LFYDFIPFGLKNKGVVRYRATWQNTKISKLVLVTHIDKTVMCKGSRLENIKGVTMYEKIWKYL
jgi:hypothetical protein